MGKYWWIFLLCFAVLAGCAGPNQRVAEKMLKEIRATHIPSSDFEVLCYQDCWNKLSYELIEIELSLKYKPKEEVYRSCWMPILEFGYCLDSECEHLIQEFGLDDRPHVKGYGKESKNKFALD